MMSLNDVDNEQLNPGEQIQEKKVLALPIAALLLNVIPFCLFLLEPNVIFLLLLSIFPFIGFILGFVSLCLGKKKIGRKGIIIAAIAVIWPIIFIITVVIMNSTGALLMIM